MTVSTETNRIEYTGNGTTAAFTFPFRVDDASHLQVFVAGILKTITTHYTVTGIGAPAGGTVTFTAGNIPALNALIVLLRVVPVTQEVQYPVGSKFPSATVELGLDQLTMVSQQIVEKLKRAPTFAPTSTKADIVIPEPVAQNLLRWRLDLSGLENVTPVGLTGANVVIVAQGDLIQGGPSGVPEVLPVGADKNILRVSAAGKAAWTTLQALVQALTWLTTKGDLLVTTGAVIQRKAVGTDAQILSADSASADGLKWIAQPVTQVAPTGASLDYWGTTAPAGWVLLSGRTIGSAASGATERANADTEALFTLLWDSIANAELPIQDSAGSTTTRGATAAADFAANKRLPVPDARGRVPVGKDDMGGTAAGRMTTTGGIDGVVLGKAGGLQTHTLSQGEMPSHNHGDPGHAHGITNPTYTFGVGTLADGAGARVRAASDLVETRSVTLSAGASVSAAGTGIQATGGDGAHKNVQPGIMSQKIIKL